jgi:hypothetical protein
MLSGCGRASVAAKIRKSPVCDLLIDRGYTSPSVLFPI